MQTQSRVKRLQLKGDCYADVQRATLLIEDALRTASFPGLPKNGLLLIRRLGLGKIHMTNNSSVFSQRIDQRFLALQANVIKLGQEEQPHAPVVWFADSIEPYTLLARLLAKGTAPVSWYWRLAVPDWQRSENAHDDLVQLILSASQKPHGAMVVAAILDRLVNDGTIDGFIERVSSEQTDRILKNINLEPYHVLSMASGSKQVASELVILTKDWQATLQKWIPDLRESDSRSFLLAISAAITHDSTTAEFTVAEILRQISETKHSVQDDQKHRYSGNDKKNNHDKIKDERPGSGDNKSSVDMDVENDSVSEMQIHNIKQQNKQSENDIAELQTPFGILSENAGLPFLVNVLQRLFIHETLTQFPLLTELNLANHVLWACVKKSDVEADDVVCRWLTAKHKLPTSKQHCPFVVPKSWLTLLFKQHRTETMSLRRVGVGDDKHLLCDSSGKITLAIWQGQMPEEVISLINNRKIKLLAPIVETNDLQVIVRTFVFAIQRYLRRYVKTGLRKIISQTGRVAATRTYLDISYPMQQINIDIRKAGLDIDPGWVPWLGRVIKFHYLEDEH